MGCCYSTANDMLLQKQYNYELTPQFIDPHWGPVYMSAMTSRQIRLNTIGKSETYVRNLMELYPQLTYTIGPRHLAYDKKNYGPNHVRFCMSDGVVLLVIYG